VRRGLAVAALAAVAAIAFVAVRDLHRGYRTTRGAAIAHFTLHSRLTHRDLHEIIVTPPRHTSLMLVLLHGRGSSPASYLNQTFFDALHSLGRAAPTVLLLDGGDHSYWHDRADGGWGSMVVDEAIPAGRSRTHARRVALGGISMGGYGALLLGARVHACAVGGHSPALWLHAGDSAAGAFDDAADYARHDVVAHPPRYGVPVWIDVGRGDPFHDAATRYAEEVRAQLHVWPGGHTGSYWRAHMRSYLRFYVRACD
jgi:enterochelin esterase-like enzyme